METEDECLRCGSVAHSLFNLSNDEYTFPSLGFPTWKVGLLLMTVNVFVCAKPCTGHSI